MDSLTHSAGEKRDAAFRVVSHLIGHGYTALYAGGYVRDMVMGREEESDIDIATNAAPQTIAKLFPHTIGVGEQFGVMIVVESGIPFEVATFRTDVGTVDGRHPEHVVFTDARQDAQRRDFTINGMFYDPVTKKILDYVGGKDDCESGTIRAIGEPRRRFTEDYLRILRAIRFASRFDFAIEGDTWSALVNEAEHITEVSPERIFAELDKMIRGAHADRALELLRDSGLLHRVLPEVSAQAGVEQPPEFHPEGDVFTHVVKALGLLGPHPSSVLAWSVLLHDIGKPATKTVSGRIRFNNHQHVGAAMSVETLKRLRASNALVEAVHECINHHMQFMNVTRMRLSTLKRFISRPTIREELELHRIDCLASHGDVGNYDFVKKTLETLALEQIKPPPLVTGKDLIGLGFVPGPRFGVILREIYDLQLEEKIHTREEALEIVLKEYTLG